MSKAELMGQTMLAATPGSTTISPDAMQAWGRIPQRYKAEIIAAVEGIAPLPGAKIKTVQIGNKRYTIQQMSSGFCVVFEPGSGRNTIVSVLTPREARLVEG
ncbi:MAG: hypothetical protein ACXU8N_10930 [Telluria sp.]